jgi:hypothetical protein
MLKAAHVGDQLYRLYNFNVPAHGGEAKTLPSRIKRKDCSGVVTVHALQFKNFNPRKGLREKARCILYASFGVVPMPVFWG